MKTPSPALRERVAEGAARSRVRLSDVRSAPHPPIASRWAPPSPAMRERGGVAALCVDRLQFLDAEAGLDLLDELLGIEIDADRVFVGGGAAAHVVLALDRGREIVDQELDLVVVGVVEVH